MAQRAAGGEFRKAILRLTKLRVNFVKIISQFVHCREMIEHLKLIGWLQQVLMIVLPMHIDQNFRDLPKHGQRDRIAIERRRRASPRGEESAGKEEFVVIEGNIRRGGNTFEQFRRADVEQSRDPAFIGPGAEHLFRAAKGKQEFESAEDEAFAGSSCARETIQARRQLNVSVGDDGEVGDVQLS